MNNWKDGFNQNKARFNQVAIPQALRAWAGWCGWPSSVACKVCSDSVRSPDAFVYLSHAHLDAGLAPPSLFPGRR